MTPEVRAMVHHLIAISAHNRHFYSRPGDQVNQFLRDHLHSALRFEGNVLRRAAGWYRLAVVEGRREKDFSSALRCVDEGRKELASHDLEGRDFDYQHAWLANIEAYLWMKKGDLHRALECSERGFLALEGKTRGRRFSGPIEEIFFTQAVLASNASALTSMLKDPILSQRWLQRLEQVTDGLEGMRRYVIESNLKIRKNCVRIRPLYSEVAAGLRSARAEGDFSLFHRLLLKALDLSYKLGDLAKSWQHLESILNLSEISTYPDERFLLRFWRVRLLYRSGKVERAVCLLEELEGETSGDEIRDLVDILSFKGLLLAYRDPHGDPRPTLEVALERAADLGQADLLTKVGLRLVVTGQVIGDHALALEACERSLEITNGDESLAADRWCLLRHLLALAPQEVSWRDLLQSSDAVLREAETWWELADFFDLLSRGGIPQGQPEEHLKQLGRFIQAAQQRQDGKDAVKRWLRESPMDFLSSTQGVASVS